MPEIPSTRGAAGNWRIGRRLRAGSELRESFKGNAYRMMKDVNLKKALYVLHAFMKNPSPGAACRRRTQS
jgi:phage-related protein